MLKLPESPIGSGVTHAQKKEPSRKKKTPVLFQRSDKTNLSRCWGKAPRVRFFAAR